ncbi:MAG: hypothetical protein WA173_08550, partial [Pseudomonas sp.]|uniref:hypothetical protein n=1 Tax=Pseudomonas sp. TaxID=306 RepID=UPI003BB7BF81
GLGFAWLANSAIQITVNTAVVTVITIAFAMLVDLFLLPIIFLFIDKRDMSLAVAADSAVPPVAPAATPSIPTVS